MRKDEEQQINDCRERWFKNHKAFWYWAEVTYREGCRDIESPKVDPIKILKWKEPQSSNYSTVYTIIGNTLHVHGDIGEAIYVWGQIIDWAFLNQCELNYFHGKCCASEQGRKFDDWCGDLAVEKLTEYLKEYPMSDEDEMKDMLNDAKNTNSCAHEWGQFIYNGAYHLGDDDYTLADAGTIISSRCIGHWVGIKMAMEQLNKK